MLSDTLLRIIGSILFIYFLVRFGYKSMFRFPISKSILIFTIPALIISINNFPISAFLNSRYIINESYDLIYMFAFNSIGVGLFEEVVFRGLLLLILLQSLPKTKNGNLLAVVISAAIFGLIHLFNIFYGSSVNDAILQVGYSFLMGMLWAVVYLKTKNLWIVMILHATYNFFGNIMFELGSVINRFDVVTIIATVILATGVFIYYLYHYLKMDVIQE